uniref:Uncharacterized protein n=1 Tax=Siphoviridae sp. ctHOG1 TaxID=2827829 RepID=A0A8S5SW15_9CAUD|nr:MAG TPA: hypothetical protein [Siphoviridae sp. ctHOG1]
MKLDIKEVERNGKGELCRPAFRRPTFPSFRSFRFPFGFLPLLDAHRKK